MTEIPVTVRRETKYTAAVRTALQTLQHATNLEIAETLRKTYPHVSDTTIHRVTHRLCEDGEIGLAPAALDGSVRYDRNVVRHDHFSCSHCGQLRDMRVPQAYRLLMQRQLGGCRINGPLVVNGVCHSCIQ